jgi:hypothetical protein
LNVVAILQVSLFDVLVSWYNHGIPVNSSAFPHGFGACFGLITEFTEDLLPEKGVLLVLLP